MCDKTDENMQILKDTHCSCINGLWFGGNWVSTYQDTILRFKRHTIFFVCNSVRFSFNDGYIGGGNRYLI